MSDGTVGRDAIAARADIAATGRAPIRTVGGPAARRTARDASPLFVVRGLRAGFDGVAALTIDELCIVEGGVTVLVGVNGSGKTTLLRVLNGLMDPWAGSIEFRGAPMGGAGRAAVRAASVMVHQQALLFRGTVLQNVGYGLRIRGSGRSEIARRADLALGKVGLAGFGHRRASGLSGGEKQRVALARALVLERPVVLLDEPTANVDPDSRRAVERAIRDLADAGSSVIVTTHLMDTAYRLCDTLVRLEAGRLCENTENILKGQVESTDEQFTRFRAVGGAGVVDRGAGGVERGAGGAGQVAGALDRGAAEAHPARSATLLCPARQGNFQVAVLPMDEIILSRQPLDSSARNTLRGRVTAIEPMGVALRVSVDCGIALQSLITGASAAELDLKPGGDIIATFKASSVRLY